VIPCWTTWLWNTKLEKKGVIKKKKSKDGRVVMLTPSDGFIMVSSARIIGRPIEFILMDLDELGESIMKDSKKIERCLNGRSI